MVFLRRCHRLGYCDDTSRTFNGICADADERLFNCITSNRRHLLHPLLAPQQEQHYLLRKRSHGYKLPEHSSSLNDSNFLTRMLYKNFNRFDDICWYLPLYFVLIVWLRFVNHLLNYYLLTYLLYAVILCAQLFQQINWWWWRYRENFFQDETLKWRTFVENPEGIVTLKLDPVRGCQLRLDRHSGCYSSSNSSSRSRSSEYSARWLNGQFVYSSWLARVCLYSQAIVLSCTTHSCSAVSSQQIY